MLQIYWLVFFYPHGMWQPYSPNFWSHWQKWSSMLPCVWSLSQLMDQQGRYCMHLRSFGEGVTTIVINRIDCIWLMSHFMPVFFFCIHCSWKPVRVVKMKLTILVHFFRCAHQPWASTSAFPVLQAVENIHTRVWLVRQRAKIIAIASPLGQGFIVYTFSHFHASGSPTDIALKHQYPLLAHKFIASCWISWWKDVKKKQFNVFPFIFFHLEFWTKMVLWFYRDSWQCLRCVCGTLSKKKLLQSHINPVTNGGYQENAVEIR